MSSLDRTVKIAIASAIALGTLDVGNQAVAATPAMEQCAGVVKAGKNDCATSTNDCHGHVTTDGNAEAWIYLPKGTCERILGGRVVHVEVPPSKE